MTHSALGLLLMAAAMRGIAGDCPTAPIWTEPPVAPPNDCGAGSYSAACRICWSPVNSNCPPVPCGQSIADVRTAEYDHGDRRVLVSRLDDDACAETPGGEVCGFPNVRVSEIACPLADNPPPPCGEVKGGGCCGWTPGGGAVGRFLASEEYALRTGGADECASWGGAAWSERSCSEISESLQRGGRCPFTTMAGGHWFLPGASPGATAELDGESFECRDGGWMRLGQGQASGEAGTAP